MAITGENVAKTGGFGCSKEALIPEESFQSWGSYANALKNTKTRLKDRLLARSLDHLELNQMKTRSQHEMKKNLNWRDLLWFGIGPVMGAGAFILTGQVARNDTGPAVVISYLIPGCAALMAVLCYIEFSVDIPVAEGLFAFLRVEHGDFIAFIAAGNVILKYVVGVASVSRSWTSYFATLCDHKPNDFRINVSFLAENYRHLDPMAIAVAVLISIGASLSAKGSARFNKVATIVHIVVILFILVAGLTKANPANFSDLSSFGIRGIRKGSSVLFFVFLGLDGVATLGEEIRNQGRDVPIGLIGSMVTVIATYCLLATTLGLMQPYTQIDADADADADAPFTLAFQAAGLNWAKFVMAFGALKDMTAVLLTSIIGQARYFTHIARAHLAPPFLGVINEKTGTPVHATVVMAVVNSIVAFFMGLEVLASLLSIATLLLSSLVSLELLVRRHYVSGETSNSDRTKLIGFLGFIIASAVGSAIYWAVTETGWTGYIFTAGTWFLATLGLQLTVKEARKPEVCGVPLVPWLPSASIAINAFIICSIDGASFLRFAVWTVILLAYYLLVGLRASYDTANESTDVEPGVRSNA